MRFLINQYYPQIIMEAKFTPKKQVKLLTCSLPGLHEDELLNLVCITCKYKLGCSFCMKQHHVGHKFEHLKIIMSEIAEKNSQPIQIKCQSDKFTEEYALKIKQLKKCLFVNKLKQQMNNLFNSVTSMMNYYFYKLQILNQINSDNYRQLVNSIYEVSSAQNLQKNIRFLKQVSIQNITQNCKRNSYVYSIISTVQNIQQTIIKQISKRIDQLNDIIQEFKKQRNTTISPSYWISENASELTVWSSQYLKNEIAFTWKRFPINIVHQPANDFIYKAGKVFFGVSFAMNSSQLRIQDLAKHQIYGIEIDESMKIIQENSSNKQIRTYKLPKNTIVSLRIDYSKKTLTITFPQLGSSLIQLPEDLSLNWFFAGQCGARASYIGTLSDWKQ